jgi:hypothetical protein
MGFILGSLSIPQQPHDRIVKKAQPDEEAEDRRYVGFETELIDV